MNITHTHDSELANRIANAAGVVEFIRPDGAPMDLTPVVEPYSTRTGVVALTNGEDALALFEITSPGTYQSHTLFAPTCRGRRAIDTGKAMVSFMFEHGARTVWGATPRSNRKACWFNRQIGGVEQPASDADDVIFEIRKAT